MTIIEELVKKGILDKKRGRALENEAKSSGKREEEIILEQKVFSEEFLFNYKAEYLGLPLKKIFPEEIPRDILEKITEETARYYKIIPLAKKDNVLEVGMVYPDDLSAQEALKFLARSENLNYKVFLITLTDFNNLLKQYRAVKKEVVKVLEELKTELKEEKLATVGEEIERLIEEAPIAKVVAVILRYGVEGKASDIHIEPTKDQLRIRFRMLGDLHASIFLPAKILSAIITRVKILSNLKIDEKRIPQDGRFSARIEDRDIDFRVSTFPTIMGEKAAIRILDPTVGLKKIEELGLSSHNFEILKKAIKKPYGMILVTGPTGSGKTTTLYAVLQILNKEQVNIITLEDPVEYFVEGINQSQIRPEIGYDFARGLRQILRQDPDIIMVGEIRDQETAALATHSSLTGHIVLSTLHTNNAVGVIPRLIDMGVQPFLIPPTLSLAVAQRLVGRLCDKCKQKIKIKKAIKEVITREIANIKDKIKIKEPIKYMWKAVGCKYCHGTGFSGRIALFEVLEMKEQLFDAVLNEPSEKRIAEAAKKSGMITMREDGIVKVLDGVTTFEEVLRETASE